MTIFDTETDRYLEQLGASRPNGDWDDVLRRARGARRRSRRMRAGVAGAVAVAAAAAAVAVLAPGGELGGRSIVDKAEAAVLKPVRAAAGTIEHVVVRYRTDTGEVFIEYETWVAADGAWCRRTVEGVPGRAADTRLTECRSPDGVRELYLPAANELLRARPGAPSTAERDETAVRVPAEPGRPPLTVYASVDGKFIVIQRGQKLTPAQLDGLSPRQLRRIETAVARPATPATEDPGPAPEWLTEDVIEAFRRDAVREAGTMTLDGRDYTKLVTADGRNTVLVDPDTGQGVAWIPSPEAFGVPTTVVQTRETLADDARTRRSLSLAALHPDAAIRDVSAAELEGAKASQFPRG